jgi:hypothetical protein
MSSYCSGNHVYHFFFTLNQSELRPSLSHSSFFFFNMKLLNFITYVTCFSEGGNQILTLRSFLKLPPVTTLSVCLPFRCLHQLAAIVCKFAHCIMPFFLDCLILEGRTDKMTRNVSK